MSMEGAKCPVCMKGSLKQDDRHNCSILKCDSCTALVDDRWADGFWSGHQKGFDAGHSEGFEEGREYEGD